MQCMGLKPSENDDREEGKQVAARFATANQEDKKSSGSRSSSK